MTDQPNDDGLKDYATNVRGDYRRAAAIITHHARGDGDGVTAVLDEAAEAHRCKELLLAVLGLNQLMVPAIGSDTVIERLENLTVKWAGYEEAER